MRVKLAHAFLIFFLFTSILHAQNNDDSIQDQDALQLRFPSIYELDIQNELFRTFFLSLTKPLEYDNFQAFFVYSKTQASSSSLVGAVFVTHLPSLGHTLIPVVTDSHKNNSLTLIELINAVANHLDLKAFTLPEDIYQDPRVQKYCDSYYTVLSRNDYFDYIHFNKTNTDQSSTSISSSTSYQKSDGFSYIRVKKYWDSFCFDIKKKQIDPLFLIQSLDGLFEVSSNSKNSINDTLNTLSTLIKPFLDDNSLDFELLLTIHRDLILVSPRLLVKTSFLDYLEALAYVYSQAFSAYPYDSDDEPSEGSYEFNSNKDDVLSFYKYLFLQYDGSIKMDTFFSVFFKKYLYYPLNFITINPSTSQTSIYPNKIIDLGIKQLYKIMFYLLPNNPDSFNQLSLTMYDLTHIPVSTILVLQTIILKNTLAPRYPNNFNLKRLFSTLNYLTEDTITSFITHNMNKDDIKFYKQFLKYKNKMMDILLAGDTDTKILWLEHFLTVLSNIKKENFSPIELYRVEYILSVLERMDIKDRNLLNIFPDIILALSKIKHLILSYYPEVNPLNYVESEQVDLGVKKLLIRFDAFFKKVNKTCSSMFSDTDNQDDASSNN